MAYLRHFGDRLVAVYVWGSVHRGEAVAGVSDLDLHAFVGGAPDAADEAWFQTMRHVLAAQYPGTFGLSRPLIAADWLGGESAAMHFRLRYDATRLWGADRLPAPESLPPIDRAFGAGSFESVRALSRFAAGETIVNETDFDLPDDPALRLRKLARLAVLGGAWYLVATGALRSLRGADALPVLRESFPDWESFLTKTEKWYIHPVNAAEAAREIADYTAHVARWNNALGDKLVEK